MKSLEQTIEHKKHLKIKENLKSLNQFVKQHFRQQSYNFYPKKNQINHQYQLQEADSEKAIPLKQLKPQFYKSKAKSKGTTLDKSKKKIFDFQGDTIFDQALTGFEKDNSFTPNGHLKHDQEADIS